MTNEELVELVQAGERNRLTELWKQVERMVWKEARRWGGNGTDLEDLVQSGSVAMLRAVDSYDSSSGAKFTTYLFPILKTELAEACGLRTQRDRLDPMQNATSLDTPIIGSDGDPLYLTDILEDPAAAAAMEAVDERDRADRLHAVLEKAIAALTPEQQEAVRGRYWRGEVVNRHHINLALARLRHPAVANRLRAYR